MAKSSSFSISVELLAKINKFENGLSRAQKSLNTFGGYAAKAFGTGAMLSFGKAILDAGGNFEHSMSRVAAISGATGKELEGLTNAARIMGKETQFSASQSAKALELLSMAGLTANQSILALPKTLNLAAAGNISLAQSADIVTNVMSGMGMEVSQLGIVNDVLAKTATSSNNTILELGEAFKIAGPVAKGLKLQITEVAKSMAIMGNSGIKGALAGTAFSGAMSRLLRQPKMVRDELESLGVTVDEGTIKQKGFINTLREIGEAGASSAQISKIFGEHWKSMLPIINANSAEINKVCGAIDNYDGTAQRVAKTGMGSWKKATTELSSATEGLMIDLGDSGILGAGTKVASMLTSLVRNGKPLIGVIGSLAGGMAVYKIATLSSATTTGTFITALKIARGSMIAFTTALKANPVGMLVGAVTAVVGVLYSLKDVIDSDTNSFEKLNGSVSSSTRRMDALFSILGDTTASEGEHKYAIKQLNDEYGAYLPKLINEKTSLEDIAKYQRIATTALKQNIIEKRRASEETAILQKSTEDEAEALEDFYEFASGKPSEEKIKASFEGLISKMLALRKEGNLNTTAISEWAQAMGVNAGTAHGHILDIIEVREKESNQLDEISEKYQKLYKSQGVQKSIKLMPMVEIEDTDIDFDLDSELELNDSKPPTIKLMNPPILEFDNADVNMDDFSMELNDSGLLLDLQRQLEEFKFARDRAFDPESIKAFNEKIKETDTKIQALTGTQQANKTGVDSMSKTLGVFGDVIGSVGSMNKQFEDDSISGWMNITATIIQGVTKIISALMAESIAGAAASGAKVPFPGNLVAIGTGIGSVMSVFSSLPVFEDGGIVGGSSYTGDRLLARVNSGEMILNQGQQNQLLGMLNGNKSANDTYNNGNVEFKIKGRDLVGVIANNNKWSKNV